MKHPLPLLALVLATAALVPRAAAISDAEAATGRTLVKQYADTIVSVEVVATLKITVADHAQPPRETKIEENGTVITASGLTVTTLSAIDPKGQMEAMVAARGGGPKVEIGETEYKDVKLRLANNTEIPAVIVLKDPDLNLVFLAPLPDATTPLKPFPFVSLDKASTGEILSTFFVVQRAGKSFQRVPMVRLTSIVGIVEKPRKLFLMSELSPGTPVFDAAGAVLGIATPYLENGRPIRDIVLTASDVAELATQAAAIKPEDKQPAPDSDTPPPDDAPAKPVTAPAQPAAKP